MVAEFGDEKGLGDVLVGNFFHACGILVHLLGGKAVKSSLGAVDPDFALLGHDVPFHPGAGDLGVKRNLVLSFAGLDTEPAADALVSIDQKAPAEIRIGGQNLPWLEDFQGGKGEGRPGHENGRGLQKIPSFHVHMSSKFG